MARFSLWGMLGLRDSNFQSGMKRAKATTRDFSETASKLKGVLAAAFSVAAITRFTRMVFSHAQRIKNLSEQYNVTVENVQRFDIAAKQVGLSFENLAAALDQVELRRQRAIAGDEKLIQVFKRLGLSIEELRGTDSIMALLNKKFAGATASADQLAAMFQLLPERAGKLLAVLENLDKTDISIINEAEINRLERASKLIENILLEAKQVTTSKVAGFLGGLVGASQFAGSMTGAQGSLGSRANTAAFQTVFGPMVEEAARKASSGIADSLKSPRKPGFSAVEGALMDHPKLPETPIRERLGRGAGFSNVDALQRIGGFTGAAAKDTGVSIDKQQLQELKQINRKTPDRATQTAIF